MIKKTMVLLLFSVFFATGALAALDTADVERNKAAVYRNDDTAKNTFAPVMLLSYDGDDYYLVSNEQTK